MDAVKSITSENDGKTFDVPESRIGCAADARNILDTLVSAEQTREGRRAKINRMANGNRPFPVSTLKSIGQGERSNFSLREFEGFVAAAKTPYYDLVFEVDRFASFTLDYGDDPSRVQEWEEKVATRYHYALDDWDGMDMNFQRNQYQMVVHGVGPMVWEDTTDWMSKSRMAGQILVPDDASADIDEWETCGVPRSYLPDELWRKIKNEKTATAGKWNVEAVKRAIMQAAPAEMRKTYGQTWEFYESELRKGSSGFNSKSKRIFVRALFQKEFSNKISHFIVLETSPENPAEVETAEPKDEIEGFLFRKLGRFDSFSQILTPFLYDVGPDGQWHSVKGAGPKLFDFCHASDRLTMRMIDGATVASGLVIRAKDAKALSQTAMVHMSGATVLHPDFEVQQTRMADNLQSPMLMKRDLKTTADGNTGAYRRRFPNEEPYPTLGQEQMDASQQAMLTKGDVNRYYRSLDKWHKETFRRMLPMGKKLYAKRKGVAPSEQEESLTPSERIALKMYSGLMDDGVPEEVLEFKNFCRIKAKRSIGLGSSHTRDIVTDKLMQLLPMADERGRNVILRAKASALGGQTTADAIFPRYDKPVLADDQIWQASIENDILRRPNAKIEVTPSQDPVIHFKSHFADVGQHAQQVQAGQDAPESLLVHLENVGPHTLKHLQEIENDPTRKEQVKGMVEMWQQFSKMADQLHQQVEEARQAAAENGPQQAPDPALIAALAKVHEETKVKREGMLLKHGLASEKQKNQDRLKDLGLAAKIRRENVATMSKAAA